MTALKGREVERFLKAPDLKGGAVLVYGPDAGLVRETAQKLADFFLAAKAPAELISLDDAELTSDPGRLAREAKTASLFGDARVLRVRRADKSLAPVLKELLGDRDCPPIILEAGNLPPRDALRALVEQAPDGRALPCYPDTAETLDALLRQTFSEAGIRVEADAIATLRQTLGSDREITRRELEKLTLYAASTKSLSAEEVLTLCADNAALAIDAVLDGVGTGHTEKLEVALNRALLSAYDPQRMLALCGMHFAQLREWRAEVDGGRPARQVLENSRPRPHFSRLSALEQQVRLWDDAALAEAEARLNAAVAESRRRPQLAREILSRALFALCMGAASR